MPSVLWFRRDLRRHDNPALLSAVDSAGASGEDTVIALFVLDPTLWDAAGDVRRAWLATSLRALDDSLGGALVVRLGDPTAVVPEVAASATSASVRISRTWGRRV